ncbi:bifunctional 23S rRNA (guanine(2069)-N(7))-methyltransferase RlmK/23S rRNA (guanine(2445)-N(2))-methyltransferase RlmL [Marinimicrobium alkaliphilum]|uniref:bifunctional 23S rRNA (guanine(2069)-N(7))-methyltransferase RlmK/23S rRNA (guanine(2445)-N(2))-methyltransferase RlmL n=1 Tax=Marinimicrobium alkaliphilum TaxID=2202654 RepID=UPI000DBA9F6A|nr:bifunctional 23S rRNA (guanine(2069)-N(7))-methyltransferase RlmK/23S rRNA (guanine(2445)-N(2))-methyltransferase RlmL [Marinimicrobium alkaliphilum]
MTLSTHRFFATCPKGLEGLLVEELQGLGAESYRETVAGVYFDGPLEIAYRACLWSRLANKILLPLTRFDCDSADQLYDAVRALPWQEHLNPGGTLLVDFIGTNRQIRNSQFGALKVKDAVVDCLREFSGTRPDIAKRDPDLRVNVRLSKGKAVLSLDLSGESLHRRGYRTKAGNAPLKENLAAAVLIRAGWPALAAENAALIDPMCGSGTFLIEGAMIAADIAPGLERASFGFERWLNHRNDLWLELRDEAHERRRIGLAKALPEIRGYDADVRVIRAAEENITRAGLDGWLRVSRKELAELKRPTHKTLEHGLVICNPPYGERLGEVESLKLLYAHLGDRLKADFGGWQAAIFTGNPALGQQMGMRADKKYKFFNGLIPSELLMFSVHAQAERAEREAAYAERPAVAVKPGDPEADLSEGAKMFANRLRKNLKGLSKWVKKEGITCYRIYDADMPEYAVAVDLFTGIPEGSKQEQLYAHVQEYAPPKSVNEASAAARFKDIQRALPMVLDIPSNRISYKQRRRNKGTQQYEKLAQRPNGDVISVREGQARLHINLWQYLDCGLFLDHRPVRQMIAERANGKRFLNLFCYTATASVHAAQAGARFTLSVDMSRTYLDWARKNLALNGLSEARNRLEQADCVQWLEQNDQLFDLILLDPPSFSNSKRMEDVLDIQRDHVALIKRAMQSLAAGGTLFFSNNLRSFTLDTEALADFNIKDISAQTLDPDFQRNRKIHQCWLIEH